MTEPITTILGGVCVAVISGTIGKYIGSKDKVSETHCGEKQRACQNLMLEKLDNLGTKVDSLTKAVNNKLLGL